MAPVRARVNTGPGPASLLWRGSINVAETEHVRNNLAGRVRLAQVARGAAFGDMDDAMSSRDAF